jgi:hypothetical protein
MNVHVDQQDLLNMVLDKMYAYMVKLLVYEIYPNKPDTW